MSKTFGDWVQSFCKLFDGPPNFILLALPLVLGFLLWIGRKKQKATKIEGRPFSEMPGPKPWPLVGTLPYYWTGEYSWDRLHKTGALKCKQFGDCVRETILPGLVGMFV